MKSAEEHKSGPDDGPSSDIPSGKSDEDSSGEEDSSDEKDDEDSLDD